jgi:hypothetical protein
MSDATSYDKSSSWNMGIGLIYRVFQKRIKCLYFDWKWKF